MHTRAIELLGRMRRRGGFLFFRAIIYAGYGYSLVAAESTPAVRHSLRFALDMFSLDTWGWIWISSGIVLTVCAFLPPPKDSPGFAVGGGLPIIWAALSAITWWENGAVVADRTWVNALVFVGLGGSMLIAAGLTDPPRVTSNGHLEIR